jgi:SAM-dependent methyltransferase
VAAKGNAMDSVKRFSDRAENYVKYRPGYPYAIVELLRSKAGLRASSRAADIGSGTGKLSELLLKTGCRVIGVEPNEEMRRASAKLLGNHTAFYPVSGTAEALPLASASIDLVIAGQAFHWFDRENARSEFQRVLKPSGLAALVWNERQTDTTEFLQEYEAFLLRHCPDYQSRQHAHYDLATLESFFAPDGIRAAQFDYWQRFDFEGLQGRLLSCSYAPLEGAGAERMLRELKTLFDDHQVEGRVSFSYDTNIFYGPMGAPH